MTDLAITGRVRRSRSGSGLARPAKRSGWTEVISGTGIYAELRDDWLRLAELQPGPVLFQMPDLLTAWARHFGTASGSAATVIIRRSGRPVLIWPLFTERCGFLRIARGAGAPIGQYDDALLDPVCDARDVAASALEALRREIRPDLIVLERVRADSALKAMLGDLPPRTFPEAAPYSDTFGGTAALMAGLKSRVVRQQKKRVRRFEEEGRVVFEVAQNAERAQSWLAEAMAIKRDWLRSTGRLSRAFVRPATGNCLADLANTLARSDAEPRMVVSRLSLDGRTAALEMGFVHRRTYHLYLGAFAPELGKFGPGNILTERVLDWCAENGIHRYDMMAPRSRNKSEWQSGEVLVADYALPLTLAGRAYAATVLGRIEPALRNAFYALPPPIRSAISGTTLRNINRGAVS
jgi:CelD/BcsL family acetyltransferase involved in cellulose biosynthesis